VAWLYRVWQLLRKRDKGPLAIVNVIEDSRNLVTHHTPKQLFEKLGNRREAGSRRVLLLELG